MTGNSVNPAGRWGYEPTPSLGRRAALIGLVALPWLIVVAYILFVAKSGWLGVAFVAFFAAVGYAGYRREGARIVRSLGAVPASPEGDARLVNLVEGLSARVGIDAPSLLVVPKGGPNALVCMTPRPALLVTREGLDAYTRTELEAVVTHRLVHLRSGEVPWSTLATLYGRLGMRLAPRSLEACDIATAALTRYPPAIASALEKSRVAVGRSAVLWFAGETPGQAAVADRIETLNDL